MLLEACNLLKSILGNGLRVLRMELQLIGDRCLKKNPPLSGLHITQSTSVSFGA